jgi:hypothetical protein
MTRALALMALAVALAGCTAQPGDAQQGSATNTAPPPAAVSGGAIVFGNAGGESCAAGEPGDAFTFGLPVTNVSDAEVQLVSADFEHIGGVELIGTWVVGPEVSEDDPGASTSWSDDYPPDGSDQPGWAHRTDVGDTTISPHSSTWVAFAIQLPAGATSGTIATLDLDYTSDAGSGTAVDTGTFGIGVLNADGSLSCGAS